MFETDDVARSIRRYVAEWLGEPWQIDLERKEVRDDARPAGMIEVGEAAVRFQRSSLQQGDRHLFCPVSVTLYPEIAEPRSAGREARRLSSRLLSLISVGRDNVFFENGRPACGPERLPFYDYEMVELVGTAQQRRGPQFPHGVLWAEDFNCNTVQDPLDPQRWTVALDMRVSWEAPGRIPPAAPTVQRLIPTLVNEP